MKLALGAGLMADDSFAAELSYLELLGVKEACSWKCKGRVKLDMEDIPD